MLTVLLDERAARLVGDGRKTMMALVFAVTLAGFVAHETRATDPVVNFCRSGFGCSRSASWPLLVATATSMATFVMPFYLQDVLRLSPSFMGLVFLSAPIFTIACANVSGLLTDRIGPRVPASIGVLVTLAAFAVGLVLKADSSWHWPAVLLGLTGLGAGLQCPQPDRDHRLGATAVPRLCHRNGPDAVRGRLAARDLPRRSS